MAKLGTDIDGSEWQQVWWVYDHQTLRESRLFVSLEAARRELAKKGWHDPQLFGDIREINNNRGEKSV